MRGRAYLLRRHKSPEPAGTFKSELPADTLWVEFEQSDGFSLRVSMEDDVLTVRTPETAVVPVQTSSNVVLVHALNWYAVQNARYAQIKQMKKFNETADKMEKKNKKKSAKKRG